MGGCGTGGNLITPEQVAQLSIGTTKQKVRNQLGEPKEKDQFLWFFHWTGPSAEVGLCGNLSLWAILSSGLIGSGIVIAPAAPHCISEFIWCNGKQPSVDTACLMN